MHHFFAAPGRVYKEQICIDGDDLNHMKNVLRIKCGEKVGVSDGNGTDYECELAYYDLECAVLNILKKIKSSSELSSKIYLFQGLPKADKMEFIIQKAVELGVYEIIPVKTRRSVVKLDDKKVAKKTERWNMISLSAAKQSGRNVIPNVKPAMEFTDALRYAENLDIVLMPYEKAENIQKTRRLISSVTDGQSVGVFIGPEGGFDEAETQKAVGAGAFPLTLGKRILRTETAGLAVLSLLMYHLEK